MSSCRRRPDSWAVYASYLLIFTCPAAAPGIVLPRFYIEFPMPHMTWMYLLDASSELRTDTN